MTRFAAAALALALTLALAPAVRAETPDEIAPRVEVAMKNQERMAVAGFFPPAFIILEIAKGIRSEVYAADITPAQMIQVLDKVSEKPLSRFGRAAVAQIRREIDAG